MLFSIGSSTKFPFRCCIWLVDFVPLCSGATRSGLVLLAHCSGITRIRCVSILVHGGRRSLARMGCHDILISSTLRSIRQCPEGPLPKIREPISAPWRCLFSLPPRHFYTYLTRPCESSIAVYTLRKRLHQYSSVSSHPLYYSLALPAHFSSDGPYCQYH